MKKAKKIIAVFLSVLLLISCLTATVFAAETHTQDGLTAVIQTDKENYSANEDIRITVTVTNNNSFKVKNVSIESFLPDTLTLKDGDLKSKTVDLQSGETLTLACVAILEKEEHSSSENETSESTTEETTTEITETTETTEPSAETTEATEPTPEETTDSDTTESETEYTSEVETGDILPIEPSTNDSNTNATESASQGSNPESPDTGDTTGFIKVVMVLIIAIAVAAAIVIITKKNNKKATKVISLVLCGTIAVSSFATVGFIKVGAEESNTRSFTVDKTITVDGTQETIAGNITYDIDNGLSLTIDQNDFQTQTSKIFLSGTVNGDTDNCVVEYKLYSEIDDYNESFTGTAEITGTNWTLDEVFLKSGNNKIVVTATYNGQSVSKTINIYYDMGEFYEPNQKNITYDKENDLHYVNNIILVLFNQDVSDERKSEIIRPVDGQVVGRTDFFYQIQVTESPYNALENICEELMEYEEVFYASPDLAGHFDTTSMNIPNDPWEENVSNPEFWDESWASGSNWGMEAIQAPSAWSYNNWFNHIDVAVVDNGFDLDHEDLEGIFKPSSILAESRNDYRDVDDKGNTYLNSHGTLVSGIIGAIDNNKKGVTGLLWDTTIYYTDWQPYSKKQEWDTVDSLLYSLICSVEAGAKVINYSVGRSEDINYQTFINQYGGDLSKIYFDEAKEDARSFSAAMAMLLERNYDFLVVQSAGNGTNVEVSPKNWQTVSIDAVNNGLFSSITSDTVWAPDDMKQQILDRIIIVGAAKRNADGNYQQSVFSNGGERVDICAPGENIYTTHINDKYDGDNDGTSVAAPHVTGVCGLVWSVNPEFTGAEVKAIVCDEKNTTQKVYDNPDYYHPLFNEYRMVNAKLAVEEAIRRTDNQGTITGTVKDEVTGEPISGVKVYIEENGIQTRLCYTNENGGFELTLPVGQHLLHYSHEDYVETMNGSTVEKDTTTVIMEPIYLTPKNGRPEFAGGDGTIENPYQVSTPEQLNAVRNDLDAHYIQINDIDMSGWENWEPIGTFQEPFQGKYNGGNNNILNLSISIKAQDMKTSSEETTAIGLFGYAPNSILENIHLNYCIADIEFVSNYFGSIVGCGGEIYNCSSTGDLTAKSYCAGGIAGMAKNITNCSYNGSAKFYSYTDSNSQKPLYTQNKVSGYFGGICGICDNVQKSYNTANIKSQGEYETFSGGIAGYAQKVSQSYNAGDLSLYTTGREVDKPEAYLGGITGISKTVQDCYNKGNLYVNSFNYSGIAGGITGCGYISYKSCYNVGQLNNNSHYSYSYTGGIVGLAFDQFSGPKISYCYSNISPLAGSGNIKPNYSISNSAYLNLEQLKEKTSYVGFDFNNIWGINEKKNDGYPYFLN